MSKSIRRIFSRDLKLKAIDRMEAGENVSALALELAVKRELLYRWRDAFRSGGAFAARSTEAEFREFNSGQFRGQYIVFF